MSIPCGHKKNTETVAQYRKRCGGRPLGMIMKMSEGDDKVELIKLYNKALKMIPGSANQKKIKKQISVLRKKLKMNNEQHTCHDCGQSIDINEAGFKFVIRNKKKIKKLICPPGTKSKGRKKCVRMGSKERVKRAKGLKVTRRKAKGKMAKTLRKRAKSMKKRQGLGLGESIMKLEELVGKPITEAQFDEAAGEKDACYRKVKARYDVWPSAYASGALVKCRKVGAANWGNSKKEGVNEVDTPMFKITYKDSAGRKKDDIMRAKNPKLAKRDFDALHKGRGFKVLKVVKESINEDVYAIVDKFDDKKQDYDQVYFKDNDLNKVKKHMKKMGSKYGKMNIIQVKSKKNLSFGKMSLVERMDKRQAGVMLKQLGGNKFIMMTGAKNFAVGPKGAGFKIGRNSKNVNFVRIDLKNDLYDMEFFQVRAGKMKLKSKVKQIFADQLQDQFTKHTGMYTSL